MWTKKMASGDVMSDIIGTHIADVDIIDTEEIGINLNPVKAFKRATAVVKAAKAKTIDRIPIVRDVSKAVTQRLNLINTPYRVAGGFIAGTYTGGIRGGIAGAKHEAIDVTVREGKRFIRNPIVRHGIKGAAIIFPPLTPVAAGVEAANLTLKAAESKNKKDAAAALEAIANTAVAASGGDPDAMRAIRTIKAVKDGKLIPQDYMPTGTNAFQSGLASLGVDPIMAAKLGARFTIPKGASALSVVKAADKLLTNAKRGNNTAKSVIAQTIAAARVGDPAAKKGAVALAKVHKAQKAKGKGPFGMAAKAFKGKSYNGYLVDSQGRVVKGSFTAR